MKTPCEERGWKVGDKFICQISNGIAEKGDFVELVRDEGDNVPFFSDCSGNYKLYLHIDDMEKIEVNHLISIIKQLEQRVKELEKHL